MANEESKDSLTAEEIAELDAAYTPFPSFEDWPQDSSGLESWTESCEQFKSAATEVTDEILKRARTIALRAAAFDTGAIEGLYATTRGLTFTVAEQSVAWEQKIEAQGPDARVLFEAQLRAFELVLDHVTDRMPQITQAWIRRIHEEITAAQETYRVHTPVGPQQQPLPQGEYKTHPNHVRTSGGGVHAYAPVDATQTEMQRLLAELETTGFIDAHPVIQASYVHYALVAIHPFADGNGRVARALASVFTYRATSVPLLILNEHRDAYFEALAEADQGTAQPFVDFIAMVARDGIELALDVLKTALAPQPEEILQQFDELHRVDRRSRERNAIALELGRWLHALVTEQVDSIGAGESVKLTVHVAQEPKGNPPKGYRKAAGSGAKSIRITGTTVAPRKLQAHRRIDIFVSDDPQSDGSLALRVVQPPSEQIEIGLDDLWPSVSGLAQHQVENFIRRTLGNGLKALRDKALTQDQARD